MNYFDFEEVYTDSREPGRGRLFIAIKGEKFDGHAFISAAAASGAGGILASELPDDASGLNIPVFVVEDTVKAYQEIARRKRLRFNDLKVIAATGSVGKTSVKEMLRAIFTHAVGEKHVLYTLGNTNNQVGVPQNLMRLSGDIRYAVIEMGTNHHGEIEPLSLCAMPDVAIVNSIAPCHLEFLGDLDGVAREKSRIFAGLKPGGIAVIPAECAGKEILEQAAAQYEIVRFGKDVRSEYLSGDLSGSRIKLIFPDGEVVFEWNLSGAHQAANAAAAAAAAWKLGIDKAAISEGLSKTELPGGRMKKSVLSGVTYFNDAYNANPASMKSAILELARLNLGEKLIAVLGDMFELGDDSHAYHKEVLSLASKSLPGGRIVPVGEGMKRAADELGMKQAFRKLEELKEVFPGMSLSGDTVFLKGSRGMALERLLPEHHQ